MSPRREVPFGKPMIGDSERAAVMNVLMGTQLVHGPVAKQFEADFARYIGGGYATSVSSCTAGLHLAYFYLGIGPGDEVILPAQTHVATAHAIELTGATPIFVDSEPKTGNIAIGEVEKRITPRTRALCVVHYLGMPVDMDRINQIARKHNLFVVEDCALAIGSRYRGVHAGLLGDIGCFSFYPVKHITTGEGGMVVSRHEHVIRKIERQKAFGVDRTVAERKIPGVYDVTMLGFNYRMNEMAAAIGIEQMKRVDGFLERRARNAGVLREALSDVGEVSLLQAGANEYTHSNYCIAAVLNEPTARRREGIIAEVNKAGVGTSIYYPMAVPHMSYYREKYRTGPEDYPVASGISNRSIALTVGPHADVDDMRYIAHTFKDAIARTKRT